MRLRENVARPDFEAIVRAHQEKVRQTCWRFVDNREDADDLAQDVFVQVHDGLDRFRGEAELSTWIYRIAVNASLDFLRREKRKKRFAPVRSLFGRGGEVREVPGPDHDDPHDLLEEQERRMALARAIDRLPEGQKTALTLSRYDEFSNQEIGAIMGLSVPAVEALLHRAKKNLHSQLAEYFRKGRP